MKFIIGLLLYTSQLFAGTETIVKASIIEGQATKKNYVANSHFEKSTVGYTTYKDAAATRPADGTGGSPTQLTISRTTSSPLAGEGSLLLTKAAANAQGEGVGIPFTIDSSDKSKLMQIDFDYAVDSGTFAAGSSSTDSDLIVYLFDVTNGALIEPVNFRLNASSSLSYKQSASFQASATSTSYRLIFHVATTSASAWALKIDNISVSPLVTSAGGGPVSVIAKNTAGTSIANAAWTAIPFATEVEDTSDAFASNTFTAKESGLYDVEVILHWSANTTGTRGLRVRKNNGDSGIGSFFPTNTALTLAQPAAGTIRLVAGDTLSVEGYQSSGGALALSAGTDISNTFAVHKVADASAIGAGSVIAARAVKSGNQSTADSAEVTITGWAKTQDTTSAFDNTTGVFTASVAGTYIVDGVISFASNATGLRYAVVYKGAVAHSYSPGIVPVTGGNTGVPYIAQVELSAGETVSVKSFQNSGGALNVDAYSTINIRKLASDSAVNALNALKIPTVQRFASGSGTYTAPAGVRYIKVKMVGGGGSPTVAGVGSGNAGASSTFGSSLLTAGGGAGSTGPGGAVGGTTTVNSPAINILSVTGGDGCVGGALGANGGNGGASALGGAGAGSHNGSSSATAGYDGTGGGGGGNGYASQAGSGGGGAGGYIEAIISSPTSYAYSVGAGGAAVAGGVKGGDGLITVEEYY